MQSLQIEPSVFSAMSAPQKAEFARHLEEMERRKREERIRFFVPTDPTQTSPFGFPANDQKDFFYSPAQERWIFGGNRSGKTEATVADCIWFCTGTHPIRSINRKPPVKVRFVGPCWSGGNGVKDVIQPKFKQMVKRVDLLGGSWASALKDKGTQLHFANGSVVYFMSAEQDVDKFGGADLDASYNDEHYDIRIFRENMARLADRNGFYVHSMTPESGAVTWEKKHIKSNANRLRWWQFSIYKNPHLSKEGVEQFAGAISDEATRRVKLEGEFAALAGMVIPQFREDLQAVDDHKVMELLRSTANIHGFFAIDPHIKKETAMLWGFLTREGDWYFYRAVKKFMTVPQLKNFIRAQSAGERIQTWIGDEAMGGEGLNIYGQESVLKQLADGVDAIPVVPTNQSSDKTFEAGIMRLRYLCTPDPITQKPRLYVARDGARALLDEFDEYQFIPDQKADEMTFRERVRKVNDDLISDARYIVMAESVGGDVEVKSAMGSKW